MAIRIIKRKPAAPVAKPEPLAKPVKSSAGKPMDGMCLAAIGSAPNSIVPWWLMASYAYYVHDLSILTDETYDQLAKDMLARWGEIKHPHKKLITPDDLKAGTLYDKGEHDYPLMTRNACKHLIKTSWGMNIDVRLDPPV